MASDLVGIRHKVKTLLLEQIPKEKTVKISVHIKDSRISWLRNRECYFRLLSVRRDKIRYNRNVCTKRL